MEVNEMVAAPAAPTLTICIGNITPVSARACWLDEAIVPNKIGIGLGDVAYY
jgi:hypothetical protein